MRSRCIQWSWLLSFTYVAGRGGEGAALDSADDGRCLTGGEHFDGMGGNVVEVELMGRVAMRAVGKVSRAGGGEQRLPGSPSSETVNTSKDHATMCMYCT
jgi:hypothetical protein